MIRVNLLEVREERRRVALRNLAVFAVILLTVTAGSVFLWHRGIVADLDDVQQSITQTNNEIAKLNKIVGEVEKIKDKKKDLEKKLEVIRSLEADRAEIVDLFLAFAEVLDEEIWVNEIEVGNRNVQAKAGSIDMQSIGVMVKKMKTDPRFSAPKTSKIKIAKGTSGGGSVGFDLNVQFVPPQRVDKAGVK